MGLSEDCRGWVYPRTGENGTEAAEMKVSRLRGLEREGLHKVNTEKSCIPEFDPRYVILQFSLEYLSVMRECLNNVLKSQ